MSLMAGRHRHSTNSTDFNPSILNCQTCMEVPSFPVTLCTGGHTVCANCRKTKLSCYVCNGDFTGVRNIVCENLIGKTRFKCQFASQGCQERIKGCDYHAHVKDCTFRPVTCQFNPCVNGVPGSVPVTVNNYSQHIRLKHGINGRVASEAWIQQKLTEIFLRQGFDQSSLINNNARINAKKDFTTVPTFYLHIEDEIFFLNTVVYESLVYWWVTTMNPTEKTVETYKSKLMLKRRNTDDYNTVQWSGRIFSVTDSFLKIRNSISAVVPLVTLHQLYGTYQGNVFDETTVRADQDLTWEIYYTIENGCSCNGQNGHGPIVDFPDQDDDDVQILERTFDAIRN